MKCYVTQPITTEKDEKYLFRIEAETTNFRMDVMNQDNA